MFADSGCCCVTTCALPADLQMFCYQHDAVQVNLELPAPNGFCSDCTLQAPGVCYVTDIMLTLLELPVPCAF